MGTVKCLGAFMKTLLEAIVDECLFKDLLEGVSNRHGDFLLYYFFLLYFFSRYFFFGRHDGSKLKVIKKG